MAIDLVQRVFIGDLPIEGAEQCVLACLAEMADDAGWCFPGIPRLARAIGRGDRYTQDLIASLKAKGLIRVDVGTGPNHTNRYLLTLPPRPLKGSVVVRRQAHHRIPKTKTNRAKAEAAGCSTGHTKTQPAAPVQVSAPVQPSAVVSVVVVQPAAPIDGSRLHQGGAEQHHQVVQPAAPKPEENRHLSRQGSDPHPPTPHPDDDAAARLEAVRGGGGWLTFHDQDIRPEWIAETRYHSPALVAANMIAWAPKLPSTYAERRLADETAETERASRARAKAAAEVTERRRTEETNRKAIEAAATAQRHRARAARLMSWIHSGTAEARELSESIADSPKIRCALDLYGTGNGFGLTQMRAALTGRRLMILERAIDECFPEPTEAAAAAEG